MSTQKSRMMKRVALLSAMSALALVVACDEKKAAPTPPSEKAAVVASTTAPASATATGDGDTEEDFEDEVLAAISPDNLEAELAKLEAEINK